MIMRKVEQQMLQAIKARKNWVGGNTQVIVNIDTTKATVTLHGNHIADIVGDTVIPNRDTFARWPTSTTCSRLCALGVLASIKNYSAMIDGKPC